MTARYDIVINQGATFTLTFVWSNRDDGPYDLSGCTGRCHIRRTKPSTETIAELTTANSGMTLGGATGEVSLIISATDTASLDFARAVYDVEIEFPDGTVRRVLQGRVLLDKEVTR